MDGSEEMFRRMAFNVLARNQDDHVKNIAFLMDRKGVWKLSPAFDMTYSYNPSGAWTANHQMTLNGKRDGFTREDFEACAKSALLKRGRASDILNQVSKAVSRWREFAAVAKVNQDQIDQIQKAIRSELMLS
jgi:serine/threonine-protein kinase HipA